MLGRAADTGQQQQCQQRWLARLHASPPAKPGLAAGGRGPGPRRSTLLYHEISAAAATMMAMPAMLTHDLHQQPVGHFGDHEMAGEGQEHAEAEDLQRMLAAQDRRPAATAIAAPASRAARTGPSSPPAPGNARSAARRDWSCRSDTSHSLSQCGTRTRRAAGNTRSWRCRTRTADRRSRARA